MNVKSGFFFSIASCFFLLGCQTKNTVECIGGDVTVSTIVLPAEIQIGMPYASDELFEDSLMAKFYGASFDGEKLLEIEISKEKQVQFRERQLSHFVPHESTVVNFERHASFDNERQRLTLFEDNELIYEFEFDQNYTPQVLPGRNLVVQGERYYFMNSSKDVVVNNAQDASYYYKTVSPVISVDISNEAVVETFGSFPRSHSATDKALSDFYPSFIVNEKGDIVASFSANDSLYVFSENGNQARFVARSRFFEAYPALSFEEELMDMAKVKELQTEAPMYINLTYNKYRSEYYRVYRHNWTKPKEKGKISVLVLNSDFEKQCEILLDANEVYFQNLIPSRKGFLAVDFLETKRLNQLALKSYEL